jgi:hypothetical protein
LLILHLLQPFSNSKAKPSASQALVAHICNPSYSGSVGSWFEASLDKEFQRPSIKNTQQKTGLTEWFKLYSIQLVQFKYEALSSNPSTAKKKKTPKATTKNPTYLQCHDYHHRKE